MRGDPRTESRLPVQKEFQALEKIEGIVSAVEGADVDKVKLVGKRLDFGIESFVEAVGDEKAFLLNVRGVFAENEFLRRFRREAELVRQFRHRPFLRAVYGGDRPDPSVIRIVHPGIAEMG